ncbi:MAG: 2-oxoglutarate dehydrogenase E1 component [Chlamydiota bacterium]
MDPQSFLIYAFSNIDIIEEMYRKYQTQPETIDPSWKALFAQLDGALFEETLTQSISQKHSTQPVVNLASKTAQGELRIAHLINAYRIYGHLSAKTNPLETKCGLENGGLTPHSLGFDASEMSVLFPTCGIMEEVEAPLSKIIDTLKEIYCGNIGIEYMGVQDPKLIEWVQQHIEPNKFRIKLSIEQKRMILQHLSKSELFESFLHTKYVGQKRFSLEGGETLIPILAAVIETGSNLGLENFAIGMAHRGRLNVLSNILDKSYSQIFSEFEDRWQPNTIEGSGDVKYHKGFSSNILTESGKNVLVELAPNPSHLEAVNPVVEGFIKAKQILQGGADAQLKAVPILIHGDAAIAGQGIVYETMQMYGLDGYSTGGTIHVVINNQVGFTAEPEEGRSTLYCTDIARAFNAPVFHVNGEDPESCVYATMLAVEIRQKFHCDVFIDLICYRKYGHNEADEPAFTQPLEYQLIRMKKGVREIYRDHLIQHGALEQHMAQSLEKEFKESLQEALHGTRDSDEEEPKTTPEELARARFSDKRAEMLRSISTGVEADILREVGIKLGTVPEGFNLHRKLKHLNKERIAMANDEKAVDWGMGELLAYGTLLWEGSSVRISGQDSGRGTFSHRHARFLDQIKKESYFPLRNLREGQGRFDVINSFLSEYGVLGFEYGYSLAAPENLVIWEAQFGDFCNGAQVMIDQFISSSEQKWGLKNNLVMLLPHGYEGQGPEHSSARMERFLTISADLNWFVADVTTPAQLFHLLRRHIHRKSPKPLILFSPKALLRHPQCVSHITDFTKGSFQEIIDDPKDPQEVEHVIFCTGKVYYDATAEREKRSVDKMAIIRVEQLYPLHEEKIRLLLEKYNQANEFCWLQEEPQNMGAWHYIRAPLSELLPDGKQLRYVGRERSAASAAGSLSRHKREYERFMNQLFEVAGKQS